MMPDKLYINKYMIRPGMLHPAEFPPDNPEEEYIRKDKILELIEKERQVPHVFGQERDSAFRDVIKIINSL